MPRARNLSVDGLTSLGVFNEDFQGSNFSPIVTIEFIKKKKTLLSWAKLICNCLGVGY